MARGEGECCRKKERDEKIRLRNEGAHPRTKPATSSKGTERSAPRQTSQVPMMSPMPIPIVEEPLSEADSTKIVRPKAPSVVSPVLDVRSISGSPVSSLHMEIGALDSAGGVDLLAIAMVLRALLCY